MKPWGKIIQPTAGNIISKEVHLEICWDYMLDWQVYGKIDRIKQDHNQHKYVYVCAKWFLYLLPNM